MNNTNEKFKNFFDDEIEKNNTRMNIENEDLELNEEKLPVASLGKIKISYFFYFRGRKIKRRNWEKNAKNTRAETTKDN